jgi:hypothetical protein
MDLQFDQGESNRGPFERETTLDRSGERSEEPAFQPMEIGQRGDLSEVDLVAMAQGCESNDAGAASPRFSPLVSAPSQLSRAAADVISRIFWVGANLREGNEECWPERCRSRH